MATKWSFITEIASKIVSPITNVVLARLLAPDAFGVVATITMIISLADLFSDAGFQKYLIQAEFKSKKIFKNTVNVAFWSNMCISVFLWIVIIIFRNPIANIVGNPGLGLAVAIASISLPFTAFSSIQMAIFRRELDFKTLFWGRLIGIISPFFVTIPLAFMTHSFWSMIIGTIVMNLLNAVILTIKSSWKPSLFFDFSILKEMFSYCSYALIEQLMGWANLNVAIFIIGCFFSPYYLGIFKTSTAIINQVFALFTNAITPVLFSSLSKIKHDSREMKSMFLAFTRYTSIVIVPIGIGCFVFRDTVTLILLGNQWSEAADFIGIWSLVRALRIVFGFYGDSLFFAIGKPIYNVLSQGIQLIATIIVLLLVAGYGFQLVYLARSAVYFSMMVVDIALIWKILKIGIADYFIATGVYMGASAFMGAVGLFLSTIATSLFLQIGAIIFCIIIYTLMILLIPQGKTDLKNCISLIK